MGEAVFKIALLALLLPAMLLVSTPFILTLALLEPSSYLAGVRARYSKVVAAWFYMVSHAS